MTRGQGLSAFGARPDLTADKGQGLSQARKSAQDTAMLKREHVQKGCDRETRRVPIFNLHLPR